MPCSIAADVPTDGIAAEGRDIWAHAQARPSIMEQRIHPGRVGGCHNFGRHSRQRARRHHALMHVRQEGVVDLHIEPGVDAEAGHRKAPQRLRKHRCNRLVSKFHFRERGRFGNSLQYQSDRTGRPESLHGHRRAYRCSNHAGFTYIRIRCARAALRYRDLHSPQRRAGNHRDRRHREDF